MRNGAGLLILFSAASLLAAGCSATDSQVRAAPQVPSHAAPQPAPPADEIVVRDEEARDRDRRGNTPPGMDRSGGGPTSGAIVDPAGAVTGNPAPRER